jgi:hypothetical protein
LSLFIAPELIPVFKESPDDLQDGPDRTVQERRQMLMVFHGQVVWAAEEQKPVFVKGFSDVPDILPILPWVRRWRPLSLLDRDVGIFWLRRRVLPHPSFDGDAMNSDPSSDRRIREAVLCQFVHAGFHLIELSFPLPWCRQRRDLRKIGWHLIREGRNRLLQPASDRGTMVAGVSSNRPLRETLLG